LYEKEYSNIIRHILFLQWAHLLETLETPSMVEWWATVKKVVELKYE